MAEALKWGIYTSILFLLVITLISAAPPTPHSVSGYIRYSDGTQVGLGTPYSVNNTNTTFFIQDETSSPATGKSGFYSVKVDGINGDDIWLLAWNRTAFAELNATLDGSMDLDLYLNKTRPPEINVSIISPLNSTQYNISDWFLVNVSVEVLGGSDATGCNFTLGFNNSVLNYTAYESRIHNYSSLGWGTITYETWNLSSVKTGSSDITVNSSCDSDTKNFDNLTEDMVFNITIVDEIPPVVSVLSPGNNTQYLNSSHIVFKYMVSDASGVWNCTLFVNGSYQNHTSSPAKDSALNLTATLANGVYNWTINCTDDAGNAGTAGPYNLSVAVYNPFVSLIQLDNPVNLLAGTNKELKCNGSVEDGNGFGNIVGVNATFYYTDGGFNAADKDNNNSHYSVECSTSGGVGNKLNYECIFNLSYYTPANEWQCNVSVHDAQSHINSSIINTNVSELYAISIPTELDYGVVIPNHESAEKSTSVVNEGNVGINISVRGFGEADGDNLSMACSRGNISVEAQHFNVSSGLTYDQMYNLSNDFSKIPNFMVNRSNGTTSQESVYWRIRPGFGLAGSCNGTIIFSVVVG